MRLAPLALLALSACAHTQPAMPARADIEAATEAKPQPAAAILTPEGSAKYNNAVESWGERLRAAGLRICRFYSDIGEDVDCD